VVRASEAALVAFTEGRAPRVSAMLFSARDGLPSNASPWRWPPAAARDRQGDLWLGLVRDAVVFQPDAVVPPRLPEVVIEGARLDGRELTLGGTTAPRVPHRHTVLEVRYTAPLLDHRQHLRYRYRLDGLENEWHEAGEAQEAYYARLPAGRYRFRVAALLDNWTGAGGREASVAFVLVPPFYRTGAFFAALALAIVLAGVMAFTVRVRLLRRRFADLSEERNRIAREIHDSLEQTLFAAKLQLEAAASDEAPAALARPLARAGELVHRAIEETRAAVWSLRAGVFGRADLQVAISVTAGEALRGTNVAFSLQVEGVPYRLPAVTEWHVGQIVREAFTNALKHARPRALLVRLEFLPGKVVVLVSDDGSGFSPGETAPGHYGLRGMKERVRPFAGQVAVESDPGRGTTVRLEIPRP
jgi:signal transduction histidine kinase